MVVIICHVITAGQTYNDNKAHNTIDLRAVLKTPVYAIGNCYGAHLHFEGKEVYHKLDTSYLPLAPINLTVMTEEGQTVTYTLWGREVND